MLLNLRTTPHRGILAAFCLVLFPFSALAQPGLLSARQVGPGVIHAQFILPGPLTVDVLSVSLREPLVQIETYRPDGLTETTVQAAANDRPGHRVLGAVNADFFSFQTGWPVGNQIVNGTWVLGTSSARSHMAIDAAGRPFIDRIAFTGSVTGPDGSSFTLSGVNVPHRSHPLILYTHYHGRTTAADSSLSAYTLRIPDTTWTAPDTLRAVATARATDGDAAIAPGTAVLAATMDTAAAFLTRSIRDGDTLRLVLGTQPALHGIRQIIGGCGRFLAGGRNVTDSTSRLEGITEKFTAVRHPRTFAGFNLDGGGSTTMVVQGTIVNTPSDVTGERPVANSLQVISTAADSLLVAPRR
ncbi:hypothetical protein PLCT1_00013 [Planctomycetaceae bacterium]|nr:hypothetical protein PLCT1_00013 [Planctomycetaceae bacterium]